MDTQSIAVIFSEISLSLYPILIKNVDTDLATQLFFRLGSYSALSTVFADKKDIISTWGSPTAIFSILSFVGVISAYTWGNIFAKEKPSLKALLGAGLVTGSIAGVRLFT